MFRDIFDEFHTAMIEFLIFPFWALFVHPYASAAQTELILLMFNQCYPIWWNFTILAKIINACGNFLMLYLAYSKILNIIWQILQIFFVVNGQIWKKKFVPSDHTVFNARSCHCAFKGFDRPSLLLLLPWQLSIVWNKIKKFSEGISKFLTLMKKAEKIV